MNKVTSYYRSFWLGDKYKQLFIKTIFFVSRKTCLNIDFLQSHRSVINLNLCLTTDITSSIHFWATSNPTPSLPELSPFQKELEVWFSPCNLPNWLSSPSWFLYTADSYLSPWQHFNNFISSTLHSTDS